MPFLKASFELLLASLKPSLLPPSTPQGYPSPARSPCYALVMPFFSVSFAFSKRVSQHEEKIISRFTLFLLYSILCPLSVSLFLCQ